MRLLLDECVDQDLRRLLNDYDCQTAGYAGLASLDDDKLLDAAEALGFDVLVTVDQRIPYQQNLASRQIAIVIMQGGFSHRSHLEEILPTLRAALSDIQAGTVIRIRR